MKKKVYLLTFIIFILDLLSKIVIKNTMSLYESIVIIPKFFHITYVINDGAAFSILEGEQLFLIILSSFILFFILNNLKKESLNKYKIWYYSLLLGGLVGNLFDRILYKGVIDFLDFKIFGFNYPIFNLADTFIVLSVFMMLIEMFRKELYGNNCRGK